MQHKYSKTYLMNDFSLNLVQGHFHVMPTNVITLITHHLTPIWAIDCAGKKRSYKERKKNNSLLLYVTNQLSRLEEPFPILRVVK